MSDLNTPATKADLQKLRDELKEAIHDSQTEMLKAFYTFAKSIEANLTDLEKSDSGIRQRLAVTESRITEIERRLNMPPAA